MPHYTPRGYFFRHYSNYCRFFLDNSSFRTSEHMPAHQIRTCREKTPCLGTPSAPIPPDNPRSCAPSTPRMRSASSSAKKQSPTNEHHRRGSFSLLRALHLIINRCLDHCVDVLVLCIERAVAAGADHEAGFGSHVVNELGCIVVYLTRCTESQQT